MTDIADLTLDPNWSPGCPTCRDATSGISTLAMLPQGRSWTLAPSLAGLRDEVNRLWPLRDRSYDGTIGDLAHQAQSKSEHNPDSAGVVRAIDITARGIDVDALLNAAIGDPRVHYVIYRGRICSRTYGWTWRRSSGHEHHVHISLRNRTSESASWDVIDRAAKNVDRWFKTKGKQMATLDQDDFNGIAKTMNHNFWQATLGSDGTFATAFRDLLSNVRSIKASTADIRRGAPDPEWTPLNQELAWVRDETRATKAQVKEQETKLVELDSKVDKIATGLEALLKHAGVAAE